MNGSNLSKLVRTEPVRKELCGRRPSKKHNIKKTQQPKTSLREKRERNRKTPQKEENRIKEATRRERSHKKHEKGRMTLKRSLWRNV